MCPGRLRPTLNAHPVLVHDASLSDRTVALKGEDREQGHLLRSSVRLLEFAHYSTYYRPELVPDVRREDSNTLWSAETNLTI